ncbi:MAG TPA: DsbA family protein [Allosphingosinicella sp.]
MALLAGGGGILIGAAAMMVAGGSAVSQPDPDRARIEGIVREYILAHPEIIPEAIQRLQDKQLSKVISDNRAAYETPFAGAWAGAEKGDVVLVEFFDYACGFCRRSNPDIERLLKEDGNLKVVWRELPVLGPDSEAASQVSLAAAQQGKFKAFHDKLFAAGRPTPAAVAAARQAIGVTPVPNSAEFRSEIEKNYELARAINATGTPTFVVGDQVLQGAVGYEALKEAIAAARALR